MMDFHVSLPPSDPCQRTPSRLSSRHPQSGNALQLLPACLAYLSAPLSGNAPESITLITVLGRGRRAQYRATSRRAPSSQTHTQQSSLHSSPKLSRPRQTSFSSSSIWAAAPGSLGAGCARATATWLPRVLCGSRGSGSGGSLGASPAPTCCISRPRWNPRCRCA